MAHKLKRRWRLAVLAALTVFAQFAMAAEPCMLVHQPATSLQHEVAADEQCDAMPMEAAACLAQCLAGDESVSAGGPLVAAMAPAPTSPDFTLPGSRTVLPASYEAPPCGPPLQILYCSYQS